MLVTGIKSKPQYTPLSADTGGRHHLMLSAGGGAAALRRVLAELQSVSPEALGRSRVLMAAAAGEPPPDAAAGELRQLGLAEFRCFGDSGELLEEFRRTLDASLMGTRLYVAGPESFIGLALKIALEFNLNQDEIRAEQIGTSARRVYCVHCRFIRENVRTNIVRCAGCTRWLLVRDHYSRRLAAYMGVMVDAEAPGELPPVIEAYP